VVAEPTTGCSSRGHLAMGDSEGVGAEGLRGGIGGIDPDLEEADLAIVMTTAHLGLEVALRPAHGTGWERRRSGAWRRAPSCGVAPDTSGRRCASTKEVVCEREALQRGRARSIFLSGREEDARGEDKGVER
jgi:hypothetical protein